VPSRNSDRTTGRIRSSTPSAASRRSALDEARHEHADHADRDHGLLEAHRLQRLLVERDQPRRIHGDRTRAAALARDEPELAEEVARAQPRHHALLGLGLAHELDLARLDHVELIARIAFVEHHLTGRERALVVPAHLHRGEIVQLSLGL
jgi:hypothetical protein